MCLFAVPQAALADEPAITELDEKARVDAGRRAFIRRVIDAGQAYAVCGELPSSGQIIPWASVISEGCRVGWTLMGEGPLDAEEEVLGGGRA
jgi:hypothetical protein